MVYNAAMGCFGAVLCHTMPSIVGAKDDSARVDAQLELLTRTRMFFEDAVAFI